MDRVFAVVRNLWMVLAVLCLSAQASAADIDLAATLSFGPAYTPEAWIPLRIESLNHGTQTLEGLVHVTPFDPVTPEFRSPIRVPGHARVRTTMWVRMPASPVAAKPEIAGLTLHDATGARVQISELVGRSMVPAITWQPNGLPNCGYVVTIMANDALIAESQFADQVAEAIQSGLDWKTSAPTLDPAMAMPVGQLYSGAYAVAVVGVDPRRFDPAQRQALLDYVKGGGVLLLPAPQPEQIAGSWLEPYLPVRLLGTRQMNNLPLTGQDPVAFEQWLPITEAMAAEGGTVAWQDAELVHAAYRTLGLGRIVFTSFPAGALKGSDVTAQAFWRNVLWLDRPALGANGTKLASSYGKLMAPMLGRQAASWNLAIAAACAVVLLTVGTQFIWRGPARPRAFAASLGISIVLAGAFTGMSMFRQHKDPLQYAVLTVADLSSQGSTLQQYAALAGPPQQLSQTAVDDAATVVPVLLRDERPVVGQWPVHLTPIRVSPERVWQVTLAQGALPGVTGTATAQFTQEGLRLDVENGSGVELGWAQLVWGPHRLSAGQFAAGPSSHVLTGADLRPAGEFSATSGVVSQDQLQKGEIVKALLQPRDSQGGAKASQDRLLLAFADSFPALTSVEGAKVEQETHHNLVRMRVEVQPSPAGTPVRVDGPFNRIRAEQAKDLPFYSAGQNQFFRTTMQGGWTFCAEPPQEIGALELRHVRVRIDLASPQHKITLRRGQAIGGQRKPNPNGEIIGQWNGQVGLQTIEFDARPGDYDAQGRLWLRLESEQSGQAGSLGVDPHWQIDQLLVDLEGQVRSPAK